jgi:hypothetical protein
MTAFPTVMVDTGYVLLGHPLKAEARALTAAWLVAERGLTEAAAANAVEEVFVANDCWWSNETPPGAPEGSEAGFVMDHTQWAEAFAITVVMISMEWVNT